MIHHHFITLPGVLLAFILFAFPFSHVEAKNQTTLWKVQSVDTMKYSRDLTAEKMTDPSFDGIIEMQVKSIKEVGATHVAIGTPYDDVYIPMVKRWVSAARRHNLNVWFRGNFAGWESWFGFPRITRAEHKEKLTAFIENNPDLFIDGDILSVCPECENGSAGDPRLNGDVKGFRTFMIEEYQLCVRTFEKIKKDVACNYFSMNGDVAKLIMDKETTRAIGGIVTIDHYVRTPEKLVSDIKDIAKASGGSVVLGEFGVPIPDIHGNLTDTQQAEWLSKALTLLKDVPELTGMNYWLGVGGSTALWDEGGTKPKTAAGVLKGVYGMPVIVGTVTNQSGHPLSGARVVTDSTAVVSHPNGLYRLPYTRTDTTVSYTKEEFVAYRRSIQKAITHPDIRLLSAEASLWDRILFFVTSLFS